MTWDVSECAGGWSGVKSQTLRWVVFTHAGPSELPLLPHDSFWLQPLSPNPNKCKTQSVNPVHGAAAQEFSSQRDWNSLGMCQRKDGAEHAGSSHGPARPGPALLHMRRFC